jgi:predicted RNA-binding Zn ribbon-like protein
MNFGDYTQGATFAAELVNTVGSISGRDFLTDPSTLRAFLSRSGLSDRGPIGDDDLSEVKRVRERIREAFFSDTVEETARLVNSLLADHAVVPHLTDHDGRAWHLHYSSHDAPVAQRIAAVAGMGLALAIHESGRARFGICSAPDCRDVYIDTSRNRSRRYCDDSCSSRTNVAAFRARQRS